MSKPVLFLLLFIGTFLASFFLSIVLLPEGSLQLRATMSVLLAILVAILFWIFSKSRPDKFGYYVVAGGFAVGATGFLLGFVGPILLNKENNLGPLFGIFITGPVSFLLGLIAGGLYWQLRLSKLNNK